MSVKIETDFSEAIAGLHELQKKQLPFAMAATLTALSKDGKRDVGNSLSQKFTLRNRWTEQGVRNKPADKNSFPMESDVHTTEGVDYLGLQEDGGEKVPVGGHAHLAIPTKYLRQMCPGVIPAELRPRNLLGAVGGRYTARTRKGQMALRDQRAVRGFVFFLQSLRGGELAILGRYMTDRDAYPFYLLVPSANVKARLDMDKTVDSTVQANLEKEWRAVWERIQLRGLQF